MEFTKHLKLTRAANTGQLNKMIKQAEGSAMEASAKKQRTKKSSQVGEDRQKIKNKAKVGVLRDQLRIRKHVNRISRPIGPGAWLGDDVDAAEL